jgi:hypothetical protein
VVAPFVAKEQEPLPEQNALIVRDPLTDRFGELLLDPHFDALPPQPTCNWMLLGRFVLIVAL